MAAEWYNEQLSNRNYLSPLGFQLELENFQGVDFFCQSANIPDMTMPFTDVPSRFRNLPIVPGGGVTFGDFQVTFIVDEALTNLLSVQKWMKSNGNDGSKPENVPAEPQYSKGQLIVTTSNYATNFVVNFTGLFPISVSGLSFDATLSDQQYLTAQAVFKYHSYTITDSSLNEL